MHDQSRKTSPIDRLAQFEQLWSERLHASSEQLEQLSGPFIVKCSVKWPLIMKAMVCDNWCTSSVLLICHTAWYYDRKRENLIPCLQCVVSWELGTVAEVGGRATRQARRRVLELQQVAGEGVDQRERRSASGCNWTYVHTFQLVHQFFITNCWAENAAGAGFKSENDLNEFCAMNEFKSVLDKVVKVDKLWTRRTNKEQNVCATCGLVVNDCSDIPCSYGRHLWKTRRYGSRAAMQVLSFEYVY